MTGTGASVVEAPDSRTSSIQTLSVTSTIVEWEDRFLMRPASVYVDRSAPIRGAGETGIQIQNLEREGAPIRIQATFYEQYDPYDPGQLYDAPPAEARTIERTRDGGTSGQCRRAPAPSTRKAQ